MYHVIVNPNARSGRGRKNWEIIRNILETNNIEYEVFFSQKHGDASEHAKELYENNSSLNLLVCGGDGTLNEVVQGLPSFDNVTISTIPIGSSNDLALALGISFNPAEAVWHLLNKPTILYMDAGTVHFENSLVRDGQMTIPDRHFLVSTGIGYDAAVCEEALSSGIKNFLNRIGLGKLSYLLICLKQLLSFKYADAELTLEENGETISIEKLIFIGGMNNKFEGGGFMFAPEASNHDGLIDLCAVSGVSKRNIIKLLPTAHNGGHVGKEGINMYRAHQYSVRSSSPLWVHTDGEVETKADFISVTCQKEAIKFIY